MPFQILDFILAGMMLVSGLLALMRGFTREVLSLIAWGVAIAAAAGAVFSPPLMDMVSHYIQPEIVARVSLGGGVFLVVLIIMSVIGVKIADFVLDSAAGTFDRTLGLAYGLMRGLLLVVIAYLFYIWLVPADKRETWVKNARSLPLIERAGAVVISFLPADIGAVLQNKSSAAAGAAAAPGSDSTGGAEEGYQQGTTRSLNQLIQGTAPDQPGTSAASAPVPQEPTFGGQSSTGQ